LPGPTSITRPDSPASISCLSSRLPRSSLRPPNWAKYRAKSGLFTSAMLMYLSRLACGAVIQPVAAAQHSCPSCRRGALPASSWIITTRPRAVTIHDHDLIAPAGQAGRVLWRQTAALGACAGALTLAGTLAVTLAWIAGTLAGIAVTAGLIGLGLTAAHPRPAG
jgi:hypothetical protein